MKLEEALKHFREGKTIKRQNWCADAFFNREMGERPVWFMVKSCDLFAIDWVVATERKSTLGNPEKVRA